MSAVLSRSPSLYVGAFGGGPEVVTERVDPSEADTRAAESPEGMWRKTQVGRGMLRGAIPQGYIDQASATRPRDIDVSQSTVSDLQRNQNFRPAREEKLQEWEGRVTSVADDHFTARLVDLTAGNDYETEEGDFQLAEISESDRDLLRENAVFRWIIGYRYHGGTKERFARIVFRRLPAWSALELRASERTARQLAQDLVWD